MYNNIYLIFIFGVEMNRLKVNLKNSYDDGEYLFDIIVFKKIFYVSLKVFLQ